MENVAIPYFKSPDRLIRQYRINLSTYPAGGGTDRPGRVYPPVRVLESPDECQGGKLNKLENVADGGCSWGRSWSANRNKFGGRVPDVPEGGAWIDCGHQREWLEREQNEKISEQAVRRLKAIQLLDCGDPEEEETAVFPKAIASREVSRRLVWK